MPRKKIHATIETKVFMMSRRRCCICFGLEHDETRKKGQIAHLDRNPANNDPENLAYLCLEHHDEYDGRTSQSKGLTTEEVKGYRQELYNHFASWSDGVTRDHLLNFLGSRITNEDIVDAVVEIASRFYFYGPSHAHDVLTWPKVTYSDIESLYNHQIILDYCTSWGLLTYDEEVNNDEEGNLLSTTLNVKHKPICKKLAEILESKMKEKGTNNWK